MTKKGCIPDWNPSGVLPAFVGSPTSGSFRSPYAVGLTDLVLRLGDTPERRKLLVGLLDYRAALHNIDVRHGFQWINGSFVEDTKSHSRPEPKDIDVVTLFHLPDGTTQDQLIETNRTLFTSGCTRVQYGVDAYPVVLDSKNLNFLVRSITYWNNLWSHDRNSLWKGYLEVDLSDSEDAEARAALNASAGRGGEL